MSRTCTCHARAAHEQDLEDDTDADADAESSADQYGPSDPSNDETLWGACPERLPRGGREKWRQISDLRRKALNLLQVLQHEVMLLSVCYTAYETIHCDHQLFG